MSDGRCRAITSSICRICVLSAEDRADHAARTNRKRGMVCCLLVRSSTRVALGSRGSVARAPAVPGNSGVSVTFCSSSVKPG